MGKREVVRNGRVYLFEGNRYAGSRSVAGANIPTSADKGVTPTSDSNNENVTAADYTGIYGAFSEMKTSTPAPDSFARINNLTEDEVDDIVTGGVKQRETDAKYTVHSVVDTHMAVLGNRHPSERTFWAEDEEEAVALMNAWWEYATRDEYYEIVSVEPYQKQ